MKQDLINIFNYTTKTILVGTWLLESVIVIFNIACILQPQSELPYAGFANLTLFKHSTWLLNTYIASFTAISIICLYAALNFVRRDVMMAILITVIPLVINVVIFYLNM